MLPQNPWVDWFIIIFQNKHIYLFGGYTMVYRYTPFSDTPISWKHYDIPWSSMIHGSPCTFHGQLTGVSQSFAAGILCHRSEFGHQGLWHGSFLWWKEMEKMEEKTRSCKKNPLREPNRTASRKFWLEKTNTNKEAKKTRDLVIFRRISWKIIWRLMHSVRFCMVLSDSSPLQTPRCHPTAKLPKLQRPHDLCGIGQQWLGALRILGVSWAINCLFNLQLK